MPKVVQKNRTADAQGPKETIAHVTAPSEAQGEKRQEGIYLRKPVQGARPAAGLTGGGVWPYRFRDKRFAAAI
jgi:hypothetical protein